MLYNGFKTHFSGFIYSLDIIIYLYVVLPMLEQIYAISGMMIRLEVIQGEVNSHRE